jgi:hypothetical protein
LLTGTKAKEKAVKRHYNPSTDKSVMHYFYQKIDLVESTKSEINGKDRFDEIWLGLPPEFQIHLEFHSPRFHPLDEIGHTLGDKDPSFREAW